MAPSPQGWRGLRLLFGLRVQAVAGEGLVVRHPDGGLDRRAEPGEVTRVVVVDDPRAVGVRRGWVELFHGPADTHGLLVFLAGRRPVLALRLADWLGSPNSGLDGPAVRRVSGAVDLAAGLGVLVDYDDGTGIDSSGGAVRRVLVEARPRLPRWYLALVGLVALAGIAMLVVLVARGTPDETGVGTWGAGADAVVSTPVAVVVTLIVVAQVLGAFWLLRDSRRLQQQSQQVVDPEPFRPHPMRAVDRGLLTSGSLQLSPEHIVITDGATRQAWLPGPGAGGVRSAVLAPDAVVLRDPDGRTVAQLDGEAWIGSPEARDGLARRLVDLGVRVEQEPTAWSASAMPFAGPLVSLPFALPPIARGVEARGLPGNIVLLPALTTAVTLIASAGSGIVLVVAGGTVLVGALRAVAAAWSANRRSRSVAPPSLATEQVRHG
jgi:hypothetical protein